MGKILIYIGIFFVVSGIIIHFLGNKFTRFGKLPGDIIVEKDNFKFYFPIVTMLIISIILSFLIYIIRKIF